MRENLFNGTSVNRQTLRIEVENVLRLLFYMLKKGEGKEGCLRGKDFLFMMVSICRYLFSVVIIKE